MLPQRPENTYRFTIHEQIAGRTSKLYTMKNQLIHIQLLRCCDKFTHY